jgi:class 3 adenylate cyclase/tetratricopeptide (TPR) repeat protein
VAEPRRERKVVTVVFADLVGFTARSELRDPEDVADELGRYHARVREELQRYGGTVEKFIGDAAMAVFGAPVAHEDDSERAVRAAFAIRDWATDEGVAVRIGINTGEALVTVDARPDAGETMAAGDVVNTAARLQSAAPVNGILVGEQAYRATERAIEYRDAVRVEAKGKSEPVAAWEAVQARARVAIDRVHGAPLVGRARELALLEDTLARTLDTRSPQLVTLVGVPGIGKSRLVSELYAAIERHPDLISWRYGRCLPYGDGVTFWALGEMVKAQAGILEGDPEAEAERKLAAVVADHWIESHLRPLVGLGGGAEAGGDARDEAFTAWRRFFEELAEERPLVLVFEDLHWADENLLDFVDHLVDWATGVPVLVVCTARPELLIRRPGWGGGKPNALTISLSPLSDEETARLLHELLGPALPAPTRPELIASAGGNPLYAEEFARMLRDRGVAGDLPVTVQGVIAARLDLLEPEQKALLQDAAVIGKRFKAGELASLAGVDRGDLERRLHDLDRREYVRRERTSAVVEDSEYSFGHLLVRDVAYGQIPRADRAGKHLAAAGLIEQLGRREDLAETLAHHYLEALELTRAAGGSAEAFSDRARAALADAGERAHALHAYHPAIRFFRGALELVAEGDPHRGRLRLRLAWALSAAGEDAIETIETARDELHAVGDVEGAAEAESMLCEEIWMKGERDLAMEHLGRARELAQSLAPSPAKAWVTAVASRILMLADEREQSIRFGEEAFAMAEQLGLDDVKSNALISLGSSKVALGDTRGLDDIARGADIARAANLAFEATRGNLNLASLLWVRGELERSERLWDEAVHIAEEHGQKGSVRWSRGVMVPAHRELGQWDRALAAAEAFIAEVEAGSPHYLAGQWYFTRGLIRLARDDDDGALRDAEQALAVTARSKDPQARYPAAVAAAHIFTELGDVERALPPAEEVLPDIFLTEGFGASIVHVLAWTLAAHGRGQEVAEAAAPLTDIPWAQAAAAFGRGDPVGSAEILGGIGAVSSEAFCRLTAARAGDLGQLEPALAFYRSVGATRFVREAESLLAVSA